MTIGAIHRNNELTRGWNGYIDDVRVYNVALAEVNIRNLLGRYNLSNICNEYLLGDINKNCYVDLEDFAILAADWLDCNDLFGTCNPLY